jgi:hypothetical protein
MYRSYHIASPAAQNRTHGRGAAGLEVYSDARACYDGGVACIIRIRPPQALAWRR